MDKNLPVNSIQKTFTIIQKLVKEGELSVKEITDIVDMPKTTVHGHLRTLDELGYVINDGECYRTSTRFVALGSLTRNRMEIFNISKDKIDNLANVTGEQASLVINEQSRAVTLYTATGEQALEIEPFDGQWFPLHTIAAGKAILAHQSDETIEEYIEMSGLERRTENTITDREKLHRELERIVEQGYAVDDQEHEMGLSGIAVPILKGSDIKAAVNLFGPASRMRVSQFERDEEIGQAIFQVANVIEVNLGYI
jgi:DNA-binding IclR family transcriptional regulator